MNVSYIQTIGLRPIRIHMFDNYCRYAISSCRYINSSSRLFIQHPFLATYLSTAAHETQTIKIRSIETCNRIFCNKKRFFNLLMRWRRITTCCVWCVRYAFLYCFFLATRTAVFMKSYIACLIFCGWKSNYRNCLWCDLGIFELYVTILVAI